jgi:4-amino-4-deoxy-L-arabinose transferase-like glycosyltransferase
MKYGIWLILAAYFLLGVLYALMNPLWEAPDEIHHFPMVQYLQSHGLQLPSQEAGTVGLWQQEGNQPPLYYLLGALVISPIDTSDISAVMRVNPHADTGIIRPDGNGNRLIHPPQISFSGSVLATYVLRFFSLLLGAATIYLTYRTGLLLFPDKPEIALGAAGINAFIPMAVYISASVNNDNLSNLLANGIVFVLARLLVKKTSPDWKTYLLIGLLTGAGLLSKLNIGLLIPIVALTFVVLSIRQRDWWIFLTGGFISGGLAVAIAAWWYWRNLQLFGDVTGLSRFLEIVGKRPEPATLAQLWTEAEGFFRTFWGLFGSITIPMPDNLYFAFNLWGGISFIAGLAVAIKLLLERKGQRLGIALLLLWPLLVLLALIQWTSTTPASQGRLMYGAISTISLWMAAGFYWLPAKIRVWIIGTVVHSMALITVIQPFATIMPAYTINSALANTEAIAEFRSGDEAISLLAVRLPNEPVAAGDYIQFEVDFALSEATIRNWSLFVHLVSPEGIILAQRDVYPARGLMATSHYAAGFAWQNPIAIQLRPTTYAPTTAEIRLGFYDAQTGERMKLGAGSEMYTLGQAEIAPRDFSINFGDKLELIGYGISTLAASPNESIELTLQWRGLAKMSEDYVVFANIIDPESLAKYASSNAQPAEWTRPTSTWAVGEIISDRHILTIAPDAVAGIYELELGLYIQQEYRFLRLPVLGTYENWLYLTRIRIESKNE